MVVSGNITAYVETVTPDSKVYGANMGPTWDRQDPGGPHVGPMYFAIWGLIDGSIFAPDGLSFNILK